MGFGLFEDIGNAFKKPVEMIKKPVQNIINNPVKTIQDIYMNPGPLGKLAMSQFMKQMTKQDKAVMKAIAKQVAKKILTHGLASAPAAAAAAATASGNPGLAVPAAILARELVSRSNAEEEGIKAIEGMGLKLRKTTRKGRALLPAGGALLPAGSPYF